MHNSTASTGTELTRAILSSAPVGVLMIDGNGLLVQLNKLAQDFLGVTAKVGSLMLPSADWPRFRELLVLGTSFFYVVEEQGFMFFPHILQEEPKETLIWMMPAASMEVDLIGMQQDLIHQRKLANLGKMIVEMAHELNNPLTGISMGTQLLLLSLTKLKRSVTDETPNREAIFDTLKRMEQEVNKITHSTSRAASLRQEVLSYSKPNPLSLRPYQTNKLLASVLSNFESQPIFQHMKIHTEFSEHSPTILCDPGKL